MLFRGERFLEQRGGDGESPRRQPEAIEFMGEPGRDRVVVLAGGIYCGEADKLLQTAEKLGGMAVDIIGSGHGELRNRDRFVGLRQNGSAKPGFMGTAADRD